MVTDIRSSEASNRRKSPRINLRNLVSVVDVATGESVGSVANLSLEGLMLVNHAPLDPDRIYRLCMTVGGKPFSDGADDARQIHLAVDCLWNSPAAAVTASAYWSGCQIIDISDADFAVIEQLIALQADA